MSPAKLPISRSACIANSLPYAHARSAHKSPKSKVNLLLSKWMGELEKVFYGNIVAFDTAMLPEAKQDDLQTAIWKNVFYEDGSSKIDPGALPAVLVNAFSQSLESFKTAIVVGGTNISDIWYSRKASDPNLLTGAVVGGLAH